MPHLLPQFEETLENIEPSGEDKENAPQAHLEVRGVLKQDEELLAYGIDTSLIGSYSRQVSIRRMQDVDVFSKVPDVPAEMESRDLHAKFAKVLRDSLPEERVAIKDRSVQVRFPDFDLYVDVVPARPTESYWEIPDRTDRGGGWQETNPERLGALTTDMNDRHAGFYVPTVKLVRQTRRAHLGKQPTGHYFEVLCYQAFSTGGVVGRNTAEYYCASLAAIVTQLESSRSSGLPDPTMQGEIVKTRATDSELNAAVDVFARLSQIAARALDLDDRCEAALAFREVLGKNTDGETVFPMPDDCNDDGTSKTAAVIPGDRAVPAGDRRFA